MQIPGIGQFGNSVAQAPQAVGVPLLDAGRGLQELGGAGLRIAGAEAAYQKELNVNAQRARTALTLATTNNALHDAHDEVARGVLDGSIDPGKATGELQTRANKIKSSNLDGVLPEQRQLIEDNLTTTTGGLARSLNGVVIKRQQQDVGATIDQFGEQVSREAMRSGPQSAIDKFGAMVDFTGASAGLGPQQAAKLKQNFAEKTHASFFETAGTGALAQGDAGALGDLVTKLQGPAGDPLDPTKRAQLTHQLYGWQQHILAKQDRAQNQAEREQDRRENAAVDIFNKGTDVALGGGYFKPEFITELTTTANATRMGPAVANLIASQRTVAGFASRPADERAAIIERMRSRSATAGEGTDPAGVKLLSAVTTMDSELRAAAVENPWGAAQKAGVIQDAPQFDMANPSTAAQVMAQRMTMIGKVEQWTGAKVSPLQPGEADKIGKMVRQMPVDQAASMLAGMGASVGDADRVAMLGKQLHDKDGALGLAMLAAGDKTTAGRYNAELILRGAQALADKTVKKDDAALSGWRSEISAFVNGSLGNREDEGYIKEAAYYVRAAMEDGTAKAPGFDRGFGSTAAEAVAIVAGGSINRGGVKTLMPRGMKEGAFDDALQKYNGPALAQSSPSGKLYSGGKEVAPGWLAARITDIGIRRWGDGVYVPIQNGRPITTDAAGTAPLKLKVQ